MTWWSYIQLAVLAALALAGSSVQVHHVDLAFRYDGDLEIDLDPVFLVNTDKETLAKLCGRRAYGAALGDVVLIDPSLRSETYSYVLAHELTHVFQFRALGPWCWLIDSLCPGFFEPRFELTESRWEYLRNLSAWERIGALDRWRLKSMWLPPEGWPMPFSLFCISIINVCN